MSAQPQDQFQRGLEAGCSAFLAGAPEICPQDPRARTEWDTESPFVAGWLLGYGEAEIEPRLERAFRIGCKAFWLQQVAPCPFASDREQEEWRRGYECATAYEIEDVQVIQ